MGSRVILTILLLAAFGCGSSRSSETNAPAAKALQRGGIEAGPGAAGAEKIIGSHAP